MTSVSGTLKKPAVFTVKLRKGKTYRLVCAPHFAAGMTVEITVK